MSGLWPRTWACIFYSVTVAYNFDVTVSYCGFCEGHDSLWVFRCLRFYFGKVITLFVLELRNWLFMKLAFIFFSFFIFELEIIICRILCRSFYCYFVQYEPYSDKNKNQWWFHSTFYFFKKGYGSPAKDNLILINRYVFS